MGAAGTEGAAEAVKVASNAAWVLVVGIVTTYDDGFIIIGTWELDTEADPVDEVDPVDDALFDWLEVDVDGIEAEIMVVVVVVLTVVKPATHLPLENINPSLLEQVLQATPLSL